MAWSEALGNPYGTTAVAAGTKEPTGFMASMPWLQVGGAILGGGLNSINQSKARMQQRNAISGAIDAERDYRKELLEQRKSSVNNDQSNLGMLLSNMSLNGAPQAILSAQQTYNQLSQVGTNRRGQLDTEVAASKKLEQQLASSMPDKYDFWDATSDFVTGAIGGGQAAQGFVDQSQARDRRSDLELQQKQAFEMDQKTNTMIYDILNQMTMNLRQPVELKL